MRDHVLQIRPFMAMMTELVITESVMDELRTIIIPRIVRFESMLIAEGYGPRGTLDVIKHDVRCPLLLTLDLDMFDSAELTVPFFLS